MTTKRRGFGALGYKTRYRLENLAGEVIAGGDLFRFVQLVEALGYEKVGETEQGFYTLDTPNGLVTHPDGYQLPQPLFEGVDGPELENFGRRVYKVKPINEEVTQ
jgi:hypothetical protein